MYDVINYEMYTVSVDRECLVINIIICACKPVVKHFSATTRVFIASSLSTVGDRAFPITSALLWNKSSVACHHCSTSIHFAVLNPTSFLFLTPLSDSLFSCSVSLVISTTIIVCTFTFSLSRFTPVAWSVV